MSFSKKTIRDIPLNNCTVLVRSDFDVLLDPIGLVDDESPIRNGLETINYLLDHGCKVVAIGHMGEPNGYNPAFSLEPAASRLANLLRRDIHFVDGIIGDKVYQAIKRAPKNGVIVLENLRFHPGELSNDPDFAKELVKSTRAKYFVQDNPAIIDHVHASTDAITLFIPSVAGLFLERTGEQMGNQPGLSGLLDAHR